MLPNDIENGVKTKTRGRPFPKGNIRGKITGSVQHVGEFNNDNRGGSLSKKQPKIKVETNQNETMDLFQDFPKKDPIESAPEAQKDIEKVAVEQSPPQVDLKMIDFLSFYDDAGNEIKLCLREKQNRVYRIQVFLNDTLEIRPMTYNGRSTAIAFWELLKGIRKK